MTRISPLSGKKLVRVLAKIGYLKIRQKGSHTRLACHGKKSVTVLDHPQIGKGLFHKILRDIEISLEEFTKLLK